MSPLPPISSHRSKSVKIVGHHNFSLECLVRLTDELWNFGVGRASDGQVREYKAPYSDDLHVKSCQVTSSDDGSLHIAFPHFRHLTGIIRASHARAWERATLSQVKSALGKDIGRFKLQPAG